MDGEEQEMKFIRSSHRSSRRARFGRKIVCRYCEEEHGLMVVKYAFENDGRLVCCCDEHLPQLIRDAELQGRHLPDLTYFLDPQEEKDLESVKLRVAISWRYNYLKTYNQYRKMFAHVEVQERRRETSSIKRTVRRKMGKELPASVDH